MEINTTKPMLNELDKLDAERFQSIDVINILYNYLSEPDDYPVSDESDENIGEEIRSLFGEFDWFSEDKIAIIEELFIIVFFNICTELEIIPESIEQLPDDTYFRMIQDLTKVLTHIMPTITAYDKSYMDDDYIKKLLELKEMPGKNKLVIAQWVFNKNTLFYDGGSKEDGYKFCQKLGYFTEPVSFPIIANKYEEICMLSPYEIKMAKEAAKQARGNVIVLGAELGYFQYLAALKEDVKTITVVEEDTGLFNLYNEKIAPLIGSNKIKIVNSNWLEYIQNIDIEEMPDFVFVNDIENPWKYIQLIKEKRHLYSPFYICDEDDQLEYIKSVLATQILVKAGFMEMEWDDDNETEKKIREVVEDFTKDVVFQQPEELKGIFQRRAIKTFL